jgi:hypothetical protein
MTERGLPSADVSPACPFVAFEDDRDSRADRPDHRHRCFAEAEPAPRALAHQEAYCLSSAFPVCPVFQTWARREAAQARATDAAAVAGSATVPAGAAAGEAEEWSRHVGVDDRADGDVDDQDGTPGSIEPPVRRNPRRDWAAPPPWASGGAAASAAGASGTTSGRAAASNGGAAAPDFLATRGEGQGLAGSAADRLATGGTAVEPKSSGPDPDLADLVGGPAVAALRGTTPDQQLDAKRVSERDEEMAAYARSVTEPAKPGKRPSVSSTRPKDPAARPPQRETVQAHDGPVWERARRAEAYPQIRGGGSLPAIPRVAVLAGALALAAVGLFFLPAMFGIGGDDTPTPSPSASRPVATATPEPTPVPAPTPQTYVIQEGDTLSGIARDNGLTLDELLAANTETIEDPDQIAVGDQIVIPVPPTDEVDGGSSPPEGEATPEP